MRNFWLHVFCFLCLIDFLLLNIIIIDSLLSVIPIILVLFFCLFPSQSCILILEIDIFHIFQLILRFSELGPWKNFNWLFLNFLGLSYNCVASKNYRSWSIWFAWFLRTVRMLGFAIISRSISWLIALSELRVKVFRRRVFIIVPHLRVLPTH